MSASPRTADLPGTKRSRAYTTRPRRIPPELAQDVGLELGCSLLAALLYVRIITQADDQGRVPGDVRWIRSVCFGMRDEVTPRKLTAAIGELVETGFLILYEARMPQPIRLIQVREWWEMQGSWGWRAYPSRWPAPPGWSQDRVHGLGSAESDLSEDDENAAPSEAPSSVEEAPTAEQAASGLHADRTPNANPPHVSLPRTTEHVPRAPITDHVARDTEHGDVSAAPPRRNGSARSSSGMTRVGDVMAATARQDRDGIRFTDEDHELGARLAHGNGRRPR